MLKKKLFAGAIFALGLMVAGVASAAYDFGTTTLKVGSKGQAVMNVQTVVGATPVDGIFGQGTKAKVMAWQANNGLTADGVFGNASKAKANEVAGATTPTQGNCPTGYVAVTPVAPTFAACAVAGTTPTMPGSTTLTGGAGELTYASTTTDLESDVKEGASEKVLATKIEADGSDISVASVKVSFENNSGNGSTKLEKYVDEVKVMLGSTEVGTVNADEFSKDNYVYSKSIPLTGAVVKDGEKATLYVVVKTLATVDDETADFDGIVTQVRWMDATGAIFSDTDSDGSDFGTGAVQTFGFNEANVDDSLEVKSSSTNPDDKTVTVKDNDTTDDVSALAFKLDVDEDSSDVAVTGMMFTVAVSNFDADGDGTVDATDDIDVSATSQWADRIISEMNVKAGGKTFEADLDDNVTIAQDVTNGSGTLTYTVEFDEDFVIASGDDSTVEVVVTFAEQSDSDYNEGVIVRVSLAEEDTDISAETDNDELTATEIDGSGKTGSQMTLSLSSGTVSVTSKTEDGNSNDSDDSYEEGTFTFYVTIAAEDGNVDVDAASIVETLLDPASNTVALSLQIVNLDGDATENTAGTDYTVLDGESNTFSIVYTINPDAAGTYYVRLDSIDGVVVNQTTQGVNLVAA